MGSNGSGALARMPRQITSAAPGEKLPSPASTVLAPSPGHQTSRIVMRFCVSVPVLSVHRTVAEPNVSMAAARRVRTRAWEIRQAPIAMKIVSTTGNSSGSIDMPMAMPASSASSQPPRRRP